MTDTELLLDELAIDRIRRHLATGLIGRHIYFFVRIPSTNAALRDLALAGADEGTVVLAERQNAGRGRRDTAWLSPPALKLSVSVLLRPPIPLAAVPVFSFIASLALTDAVRSTGLSASIQWPHDVLVEGRKVAGCLVDVHARANRVDHVILGAGIDLDVPAADPGTPLGGEIVRWASGTTELSGCRIDRNLFTATLLNHMERWLTVYAEDGAALILAAWRGRDALAGREVSVSGEGLPYRGRAVGVDETGYLVVETESGRRRVTTGQISCGG
jgi:BirA family biotin operon repressor/biotin-[acetyl-CoA-carboxylase] ligase